MEERCVPCQVAGKEYPMCMNVRATKAITARYGELRGLGDALRSYAVEKQFDEVLWLLELLLREGCALENYLHPDGEALTPPPAEVLEIVFTPGDLVELKTVIFRCLALGMGREVPTEPTEDDGKNREAGQETTASSPG